MYPDSLQGQQRSFPTQGHHGSQVPGQIRHFLHSNACACFSEREVDVWSTPFGGLLSKTSACPASHASYQQLSHQIGLGIQKNPFPVGSFIRETAPDVFCHCAVVSYAFDDLWGAMNIFGTSVGTEWRHFIGQLAGLKQISV